MALRFQYEFDSSEGNDWKIEIHDTDYVGDVVLFKGDAFTITYEASQKRNLAGALMPSTVEFDFIIELEGGQEGLPQQIVTSSETRFSVVIYRSSIFWWAGAVVPDVGTIADEYYPYSFRITAVCGLGLLADYDYIGDTVTTGSDSKWEDTFTGFDKLLTIIARCLKKLPHVATHFTANDTFIKTAANWYHEDTTYDAANDPFNDLYLLNSLFSGIQTSGNANPDNCAEVIEKILDCFNAKIYLSGGVWIVEQYETRTNLTDNYVRAYPYDLSTQDTDTLNAAIDINPAGDAVRLRGAAFGFSKALKKCAVTLEAQTRYNLAAAARFDQDTVTSFNAGNVFWVNTTSTFRAKGSISGTFENVNIPPIVASLIGVTLVFRLQVNLASNYLEQVISGSWPFYYTQMAWSGSAAYVEIPIYIDDIPAIGDTVDFSKEFDFVINTPTGTQGNMTIDFDLNRVVYMHNGATITDTLYAITWRMNNPYFAIYFDEDIPIGKQVVEVYNDDYVHSGSLKLNTYVGDAIGINDIGALRRLDTGSYFETDNWSVRDTAETGATISELLARRLVAAHPVPKKTLRATIYNASLAQDLCRAVEYETLVYLFMGGVFNAKRDELQGEWIQAEYDPPTVTVVQNADSDTSSYNPPPVVTNTTNQNITVINPAQSISALLNSLGEYDSDALAEAGGVEIGGWYRAGTAHDRNPYPSVTQRLE